ncbi:MAG: PLP-dependent aminotransferase family protein [Clostridia bacterium]|nr:PLP-dependent aminotransferase family protein [Clostridia bacterium]
MKYVLSQTAREPLYLQLYYQIRRDIAEKILPPGTKLPSKRVIAEECGVSVITVEHTYSLLCDEGYAVSKERSGFFVASDSGAIPSVGVIPQRHAPKSPRQIETEFPLSSFKKHMRGVIADYSDELLERSPNNGCEELRRAISGYLDRFRGLAVPPGQIVIGSGAEYMYSLLIQLFGRDRLYAIEDPCYRKIEQVYSAQGIDFEKLPLGDDGIKSASLNKCRAGVLHITPYHSFPSGVTATPAKRRAYVEWAKKADGYIIEDDYESEFSTLSKPVDTIYSLDPDGHVIYMNTFTKTLAPSIRVGYMVLPEKLSEIYSEKLGFYSCTVPVFDQLVLASFIDSGEFERHINKVRRHLRNLTKDQ